MLISVHKGSLSILLGVFTCSTLSYSAQTVSASDFSDLGTRAGFNNSKPDSSSTGAGAFAGIVKFIIKDVVFPAVSLMLNALVKILAILFATPIPYILLSYIPYYNFYVLHKDNPLGLSFNILTWAPRKILSIFDDSTSEKLITCEDLAEQLGEIEKSLNELKGKPEDIRNKLDAIKGKVNRVTGNFSGEGAFSKKFKYELATTIFPSTGKSYEKSRKKIDELYKILKEQGGVFEFYYKCGAFFDECLSIKSKKERGPSNKFTAIQLKKYFLNEEGVSSKEDLDYTLSKVKKRRKDIESLISEYDKNRNYEKFEVLKNNYNELKNLLDVIEAEKKVSEINEIVANMDDKEKGIMYDYTRFSKCVNKIKEHYSTCISELKVKIVEKPLSYSDKVRNYYLNLKIDYFKNKSKRIDVFMEKLPNCKEKLKSIVENFKDFRSLKENEKERNYLFSILNKEIFENKFLESDELKSLPSLYKKKDNALISLVEGELVKYKIELLGNLENGYRNWRCKNLLEYCFGEKSKNKDIVTSLKNVPFGGKNNLFSKKKLEDILNKIKNKKNDIEALIKEYDEDKNYRKEEYKKDKNAEKNYNDLKGLLDVISANEEIDEIDKIVADIDKEEDRIWFHENSFSTCCTKIKKLYSDYIEELEQTIQGLPNNYSGEVLKFYLKGKIEYFKNNTNRIDALDKALSNCKEKLKSIVENFKDFRPLGEDKEENEYLSLIFDKEILEDKFQKSEEHVLLLNLCNDERSGMYDFVRRELNSYHNALLNNNLKNKYKNWKQKLSVNIRNNWCKTIKGSNNKEKEGDNDKTYGLNEPRDKNNCNKKKRYMKIKFQHKNDNSGNKGTGTKKGIKTPKQEISKEQLCAGDNSLNSTDLDD